MEGGSDKILIQELRCRLICLEKQVAWWKNKFEEEAIWRQVVEQWIQTKGFDVSAKVQALENVIQKTRRRTFRANPSGENARQDKNDSSTIDSNDQRKDGNSAVAINPRKRFNPLLNPTKSTMNKSSKIGTGEGEASSSEIKKPLVGAKDDSARVNVTPKLQTRFVNAKNSNRASASTGTSIANEVGVSTVTYLVMRHGKPMGSIDPLAIFEEREGDNQTDDQSIVTVPKEGPSEEKQDHYVALKLKGDGNKAAKFNPADSIMSGVTCIDLSKDDNTEVSLVSEGIPERAKNKFPVCTSMRNSQPKNPRLSKVIRSGAKPMGHPVNPKELNKRNTHDSTESIVMKAANIERNPLCDPHQCKQCNKIGQNVRFPNLQTLNHHLLIVHDHLEIEYNEPTVDSADVVRPTTDPVAKTKGSNNFALKTDVLKDMRDSDITVVANPHLKVQHGGKLPPSSGYTVDLDKSLHSRKRKQILNPSIPSIYDD